MPIHSSSYFLYLHKARLFCARGDSLRSGTPRRKYKIAPRCQRAYHRVCALYNIAEFRLLLLSCFFVIAGISPQISILPKASLFNMIVKMLLRRVSSVYTFMSPSPSIDWPLITSVLGWLHVSLGFVWMTTFRWVSGIPLSHTSKHDLYLAQLRNAYSYNRHNTQPHQYQCLSACLGMPSLSF